mgnify:CR=1 FL=1
MNPGILAVLENRRIKRESHLAAGGRECKKCGEWFPWDKLMTGGPSYIMGKKPICKICGSIVDREYAQSNPELLRERKQRWRRNNPERIKEHKNRYNKKARAENLPSATRMREYRNLYSKASTAFEYGISSPLLNRIGFSIARSWEQYSGRWQYRYRAARPDHPLEQGETLVARIEPFKSEEGKFLCFPSRLHLDTEAHDIQRMLVAMTMRYSRTGGMP